MKNRINLLCFFVFVAFSCYAIAKPSVYINASDFAAHAIKNNRLSLNVSIEFPINNKFDYGVCGGYSQSSNTIKRDLNSFGVYLDYKLLESDVCQDCGVKYSSWFIRNYVGLSKINSHKYNSVEKNLLSSVYPSPSSKPSSKGNDYHISVAYATTSRRQYTVKEETVRNIETGSKIISGIHPEVGVYIGKKYVFYNNIAMQMGIGISTVIRPTNITNHRLKNSDFILDSFIKIGYKI